MGTNESNMERAELRYDFMVENKIIAIIPARGGSKRIQNKNVIPLNGKPLIEYTIESAIQSKKIQKIVVTSDSDEILGIAKKYENITAHKRKENISNDYSPTSEAIIDVLKGNEEYDFVMLLQPTSPLRGYNQIIEAIELLNRKNAKQIVSVTKCETSPLWCNKLDNTLSLENFFDESKALQRSQDLEQYYKLNGAIYISDTKEYLKSKSFFSSNNKYAYIMDRNISIDIDEELDLHIAESLIKLKEINEKNLKT
jgi:CMP-N-acetylneuraminic acid synthetase